MVLEYEQTLQKQELQREDTQTHQNDETPSMEDRPDITDDFAPQVDFDTPEEDRFRIGDIVMVMRRMWPGMNNPGGVGRIAAIHFNPGQYFTSPTCLSRLIINGFYIADEDTHFYEVHYVLGGKETKVEGKYIKIHIEEADRGRSTRGRCRFVKSLTFTVIILIHTISLVQLVWKFYS